MWSLGCSFYIVLSNKMPFNERDCNNAAIMAQQRRGAPSLERVSRSLRAMIVRMMTYDAASRPSIDALAATDHWHRAHAHLADGQTHIHWLRAQQPGTSYATTAAPRPIYY